jgi:hypothetical protein
MRLGKRRIALFLKIIIYTALLNLGVGVYLAELYKNMYIFATGFYF